jgi:exopolysaccharide production protein ExoY
LEDAVRVASVRAEAVYEGALGTVAVDLIASESRRPVDHSSFADVPSDSWRYQFVKRMIDILGALAMIIVFAIPGLFIAAAIVLTSRGPIFYHEQRIGREGRLFRIWKFRSMHSNAVQRARIEEAGTSATGMEWRMRKNLPDPRITAVGSFLRRWSLDELPQLLNVLRGEMSLVGPRPIVKAETEFYGDLLSFYLAVNPGLSGLWQVSGRSHVDYEKRARLDALYVRSWTLRTDLNILFWTLPAVLSGVGAS